MRALLLYIIQIFYWKITKKKIYINIWLKLDTKVADR